MGILTRLAETAPQTAVPEVVAPAAPDGAFSQGLRQGMTTAGGQLHALAGGVGEALGANDFAARQYAQSQEAQQLAATQAPAVTDWRDVMNAPDLSTGLRRAGTYVAGLAGQSAPMLGAGLGALGVTALTHNSGALPALLAGTAAVAPFETGGALQRQQADPEAMKHSAGERLQTAALEGTARSAATNVVPHVMGGRVLGRIAGGGVPAILAEGVGGNALAGAASEKASMLAEDHLNPNRDTGGDNTRMVDAAVSGAALGLPFAGAGIAGHALHGKGGEAAAPAKVQEGVEAAPTPAAPAPGLVDKIKSVFTKDTSNDAAQKMAAGQDGAGLDVEALKKAPPEQQVEMLRADDAARAETAKSWYQELMQDGGLSEEKKAALQQAATDFTDRASQAAIAGAKLARDGGEKAMQVATDFYNSTLGKKDAQGGGPAPQKSEVSDGVHKVIADTVAPLLAKKYPQLVENDKAMAAVTGGLRRTMQTMQSEGKLDTGVAQHLRNWFGKDATDVMVALHDKVLGDDASPQQKDSYYRAVQDMADGLGRQDKLAGQIKSALDPEVAKGVTPDQLDQMAQHIKEYVSGATLKDMTPAERAVKSSQIENAMREHFGDKTDELLQGVTNEMDSARERDATKLDDARAEGDLPDDHVERAGNSDDGFADHTDAGITTEQDTAKQYFGGGRDKANPQFMLSEQAHRALYGNEDSQHAKVLRRVASENPDMNVTTVRARDYAREHGLSDEQLQAMTKGDPDNHVMVKAEGIKREGLSWQDVDRARLDTTKYSDSPSRIDTENGPILDATKIAKMYAPEHMLPRDEHDAVNPMYRLRRQMTEALGALSDHLGESVEPDPHTVVAYRRGKPVTWKEVQEQGRVEPDAVAKKTSALYAEREAAVKAGDVDHVATLDADIEKRTGFDDHEEPKNQGSAALAKAAKQLGAAHDKLMAEVAKGKPREGRAPTLRENVLIREYREAVKRYEQAESRLADQRMGGELHSTAEDGTRMTRKAGDGEGDIKSHTNMESASWGGASEMDPSGQVHLADAQHGDKLGSKFAASRNMEAGPEGNLLHTSNFEPDTHFDGRLPADVKSAIAGRVQQFVLGKSAAARAVGEKGQHLLSVIDQMRKYDAAELASVVKEASGAERASTINNLYARYKDLQPAAPKPGSFVDRVVGSGNIDAVVKAIVKSSDTKGLQRAVDALIPHQYDASARRVLEVANERLGKLVEAHPDIAYSMQRVDPQSSSTSKVQADVRAHIEKVLGKTVDVEFAKMLHAGEFLTDPSRATQGLAPDLIRISVHSLDPMGVAHHESLHALFAKLADAGLMDEAHPLQKAADSAHVLRQLRDLLKNEPDALKQLDTPAERAAYMYQFWATGKLHLAPKPAGITGHIAAFFKKTLGLWTNDERAEHIMQYFHSGEYAKHMGDRSAVGRALLEGTNGAVEKFKDMVRPLARFADAVASTGDARLRATGIEALAKLADHVYAPLHGEHGADPGYIPASRAKRGEFMNRLGEELGKYDAGTVTDALESMQRGLDGSTPKERMAVAAIRKVLGDVHQYMLDKKVDIGNLGPKYFPRVWDPQTILRNEQGFRDMLQHYVTSGEFKGSVDQVMATLTRSDGSDLQAPTIKPGMQAAKERVLHFISDQDAAPFLNKNLYETLNSYITQAARRAEWAHRFGDDNKVLHELMNKAQAQGASAEHLQTASDYLQGVDGTLGDHIDPKLRRAFGNMIVYQNVRLLPLALFSSVIDPMGILVRGGSVRDTFSAMKRGFAEIPKGFKKDAQHDSWTQLAATMGVIDNAVLMHNLGTSFSQGMTSTWGRKINDTFFKYNLMEQYNTSMRVAATQAAVHFLAKHADGSASTHSPRWLAELGFKPGEVKVKDGMPLVTAREFEAAGMDPQKAQAAADKMTLAVNKWVDGAILRPNAAHKPIWMNDPHFALVAHLKQFVYSFQETIMKRVANEAKFGNIGPAYALAAYVPFMLAADTMKGMIQGGGEQPDWKKGWDAGDYAFYEVQRAGLFGVGQFAVDAAKDMHRGGLGIGALAGPTIEQLGEAVRTVAGPEQFKTFAVNALPANTLFDAAGAASASTNAMD